MGHHQHWQKCGNRYMGTASQTHGHIQHGHRTVAENPGQADRFSPLGLLGIG